MTIKNIYAIIIIWQGEEKKTKGVKKMDKDFKKKLQELFKDKGKVKFKPNKSYTAIWLKCKKNEDLILCYFQGKRKNRLCLPWSTIDIIDKDIVSIVSEFLEFKKSESISKNIGKLEKILKEKGLL